MSVASINRWAARDTIGQTIKAVEQELVAVDDRTFRWVLKKPYPKMLLALGKISTPCCFIMPARIAATDPFKQINEYVGWGPMRFVRRDWVPGAKSAFESFADYVPRAEEASWMAGGKRIIADRIEWITMPDAATAAAALQNREVDWWEVPLPDLIPMLRKNRNVVVDIQDRYGNIGVLAMNHLFPPFNDVRARRAILMALNQEEYMRAYVGDDAGAAEADARIFHARLPSTIPSRAATFSKARATSMPPSVCSPRAAIPASRSSAWPRRTSRTTRHGAMSPPTS